MKKCVFIFIAMSLVLASCEKEEGSPTEFKYALGSSTDYRYGKTSNFYYSSNDSTARLKVAFANGDSCDLLWITPFHPNKTGYVFGQYYGVDCDIMVVNFRNNESNPPYWVVDNAIGRTGTLTITSFADNKISGSFDFNMNTMNPQDFSTAVYNFKGSFNNVPVIN